MSHDKRIVTRRAFAKVNFSLDVGPRRADGYHSVSTVMQTISHADTLTVEQTEEPGVSLETDWPTPPPDEDNLVWRAATSFFRRRTSAEHGVRIRLSKRIPIQAGLGGGSSDAAATLLALNDLFGRPLCHEELEDIGAALGSDVVFFLRGGTALMQGRGEQGRDLPDAPELTLVIVKPRGGVSTAEAYRALDAHPDAMRVAHTEAVVEAIQCGDRQGLLRAMGNHFECVVGMLCPDATRAMGRLIGLGALGARLCGSGSAVFGVAQSEQEAERIANALRADFESVWVCRTVGRGEAIEG